MRAVARILFDVLAYRLRKLEMANVPAAIAIMLVLRLSLAEIALRTLAAVLLNVLVYLNNDYFDVRRDLGAKGRDVRRTQFLAEHLREARAAQLLLAAALVPVTLFAGGGLIFIVALGAGICVAYSAKLKSIPYADVLSMIAWGGAMPMCGAPLDDTLGLSMAGQLALYSGVFETMQVRRDREEDAAAGLRTTAVVLGNRATVWLTRALLVASAIYCAIVLHPIGGALSALALFVGTTDDAARDWKRVKVVLGVAWLITCALVYLRHGSVAWPAFGA